jgi:hypothetical protein
MEAKIYNIDNLQIHQMFYMLDSITEDSVRLFRRTPSGDEEFFGYDLHRMFDGKLLVAFYRYWEFQTVHSLVAICGDKEEYVSVLPFERVMEYLNPTVDYADKGIFIFANSKPIYVDPNDWRCDNTFYGSERYVTSNGFLPYQFPKAGDFTAYEPIINISGVSNLIYINTKEEEPLKNIVINEDIIPSSSITLSEMFRLISEWAVLADAPFNSTEPISLDAKEFLKQIGFDSSLVADQVDMQVAEYFKGNTDARKRPSGVVETNQALLDFVKRKMAHMSLYGVLSCYPEYGNLEAEIQRDIDSVNNEFLQDISNMGIEGDCSFANYEDFLDLIPSNYVNGKQTYTFRWGLLKTKLNP